MESEVSRAARASLPCAALVGLLLAGAREAGRGTDAGDFKLADGYRIEPVVIGLSLPTTAVFDGDDLLIAESGFESTARPRVLRVRAEGSAEVVAEAGLKPPVTGLLVDGDALYVSHRGAVSRVERGLLRDVVSELPSDGDHHNNQIAMGPDGRLYLGQGTTTNAGVVGVDNFVFGWLQEHPAAHEVPCRDVTLVGESFETENPLTPEPDKVRTGAYAPLGTPGQRGQVVRGRTRCGGSIVSFTGDGDDFQLVAWGLRNPFGLAFDQHGQLWATSHGADVRGSRNIFNDPDTLVRVERGAWYGWPDYFDGEPVTAARFRAPDKARPRFLWQQHPPLSRAFTTFASHSGASGIAFAPRGEFGFEGDAFVATFGTFAPLTTGVNMLPVGFRVVRVDMKTGEVHDFAKNDLPGPAYITRRQGFNRPVDTLFGPDGSLYVVDWGATGASRKGPRAPSFGSVGLMLLPGTGVVWRIYRAGMASGWSMPVRVPSAALPETLREPEVPFIPETCRLLRSTFVGGAVALAVLVVVVLLRSLRRARRRI